MQSTREVFFARSGSARVVTLRTRDLPPPKPFEVQVKVEAAGVAYADIVIRLGLYAGAKPPIVPGYDLVGRVAQVGAGVSGFNLGDRVAGVTVSGAQATYSNVPSGWLVPAPEDVDAALLVAGVLNGVTAFQMFNRLSQPGEGEWVLVHGAGGGVGNLLLELARHAGVRTIGTGSAAKLSSIEAAGATALDYTQGDVAKKVRAISGGGVVAVFDHLGGKHFFRVSMPALRPGGTGIVYGGYAATDGGRMRPLEVADLLFGKKVSPFALFGSSLGVSTYSAPSWRENRREVFRRDLSQVLGFIAAGDVSPLIGARLPLESAADAHRLLETRQVSGKIVLIPDHA